MGPAKPEPYFGDWRRQVYPRAELGLAPAVISTPGHRASNARPCQPGVISHGTLCAATVPVSRFYTARAAGTERSKLPPFSGELTPDPRPNIA